MIRSLEQDATTFSCNSRCAVRIVVRGENSHFTWSKPPPPPLISTKSVSTSSAPSIVQSSYGLVSRSPSFKPFSSINRRDWRLVGIQITSNCSWCTRAFTRSTAKTTVDPLPIPMVILFRTNLLTASTAAKRFASFKLIFRWDELWNWCRLNGQINCKRLDCAPNPPNIGLIPRDW